MKSNMLLFSKIDKKLNIGLIISVACVLLVEFVLDNTEELFSGGAKIGMVLSNLSLAFIASTT